MGCLPPAHTDTSQSVVAQEEVSIAAAVADRGVEGASGADGAGAVAALGDAGVSAKEERVGLDLEHNTQLNDRTHTNANGLMPPLQCRRARGKDFLHPTLSCGVYRYILLRALWSSTWDSFWDSEITYHLKWVRKTLS